MEEAITSPISEKKLKQSTEQRNHKHPKNSPYFQKNKPDTLKSMDKSRSTQRNNLYNRSTRIEKPTEIDIFEENKDLYDFSWQGDDLVGITPDILCIPCKKKRKNTPDTSIIRKIYSRTSQPK